MNGEHYEDYELLAWLDGSSDVVDLESVSAHLLACSRCEAELDELRNLIALVGERDVHLHSKRRHRSARQKDIQSFVSSVILRHQEDDRAEPAFLDLMVRPVETWAEYLSEHREKATAALVRRCIEEARREFDQRPKQALRILDVAGNIASALPDFDELTEQCGNIAKERANVFRMLGSYPEALESLDYAERFLSRLACPEYDVTFVRWARASVLFYMARYAEAVHSVEEVIDRFEHFGAGACANQARVLLANINCEQGKVHEARDMYLSLLRYFERKGDADLVARLNANLSECEVRLDHHDAARAYAARAMHGYEVLGKPVERIRVRWILGYQTFRQGHHEIALDELTWACAAFEALGMLTAAGSVGLDMTELHLAREEWKEAEQLARYLVNIFSTAAASVHLAQAFGYLRDAVERQIATVALIDYLRSYVDKDDAEVPFLPPPTE